MADTLTSEQITYGSGPQLTAAQLDALANFMTDLHFTHVERISFGLVTWRRSRPLLTCALFGRFPLLVFHEDNTVIHEDLVERRWRVVGGWLRRQGSTSVGVFTLGVRLRPALANRTNWTAWVRLEDFPASLLDLWPNSPARLLGKLIARIYAAYHARVSRGYLHQLALRLDSGQSPRNADPDPGNLLIQS